MVMVSAAVVTVCHRSEQFVIAPLKRESTIRHVFAAAAAACDSGGSNKNEICILMATINSLTFCIPNRTPTRIEGIVTMLFSIQWNDLPSHALSTEICGKDMNVTHGTRQLFPSLIYVFVGGLCIYREQIGGCR